MDLLNIVLLITKTSALKFCGLNCKACFVTGKKKPHIVVNSVCKRQFTKQFIDASVQCGTNALN